MVTYIQRDSNSDRTPTWPNTSVFDKEMIEGIGGGASFDFTIPSSSTRSGAFISIADKPNNDAMPDGGTQTIEVEIVSGNMNITARCRIVRLDAAGNIEESGAFTATQTLQTDRTFSPVSPTWGSAGDAELCTDRLAIEWEFVNVDAMMGVTITWGTGAVENEVILDIPENGGSCGGAAVVKFVNQDGADME